MLNLGQLEFVLGINTRGLDSAVEAVRKFGNTVSQIQGKANKGLDTNIAAYRKIENSILSAGEKLNAFIRKAENAKIAPEVRTDLIRNAEKAYQGLVERALSYKKATDNTNLDRTTAKYANSINDLSGSLTRATSAQRELDSAQRSAASSAKQAEAATMRQANALARAQERAKNLATSIETANLGAGAKTRQVGLTDQIERAFSSFRTQTSAAPLNPQAFQAAARQYEAALGDIRRQFQRLKADSAAPALENWKEFRKTLQTTGQTMLLVNGHLGGMSTRFFALGSLMGEVGIKWALFAGAAVGAGLAITTVGQGALETALKIQRMEKAMNAVTGSSAIAASQIKELKDIANQAGVEYTSLAGSYTKFLAASKAAGQTYAQSTEQFKGLALAAGTMGLSVQDTEGTFRALEQILSKGTVQAEELRGQLGDRLPGAFNIAAVAMGKTTRELGELMKKGDVISRDFVPKFVKALMTAYNIDPAKPIDTLQAAINRGTNAVTEFYDAFGKNTDVVNAATNVVNAFAKVLNTVTANMSQIVQVSTGVAGAIAGMTAAWVTWTAVAVGSGALVSFIGWMRAAVALIASARTATEAWTAAQAALNIAVTASPIGRIVTIIAKLALAIGGAIIGYKVMDSWINKNSGSFDAGLSHIQQYINQQKALGWQVKSVTNDLIKQASVLAKTAAMEARAKLTEFQDAKNPSKGQRMLDAAQMIGEGALGTLTGKKARSVADIQAERVKKLREELAQAGNNASEAAKALRELNKISELPDQIPGTVEGVGSGKGKDKTSKMSDNIKQMLGLVDEYQEAMAKLDIMSKGGSPEAFAWEEALKKANKALNELNPKQLANIAAELDKAGFKTGTLEERLAKMIQATEKANKSADAFIRTWEGIDEAKNKLDQLEAKIKDIAAGPGAFSSTHLENLETAKALIKDLGNEGIKALALKLAAIPQLGSPAIQTVDDLAHALARLYDIIQTKDDATKVLQDFQKTIDDIKDSTREMQKRTEGMKLGIPDDQLDSWVRNQLEIDKYARALEAAGLSADEVRRKLEQLRAAQAQEDAARKTMEAMERVKAFFRDMSTTIAQAVGKIAQGGQSIAKTLKNMFKDLWGSILDRMIVRPLQKALDTLFDQIFKSISDAIAGAQGGTGGGNIFGTIFKSFDKFLAGQIGGGKANGGLITGAGTSKSDSILTPSSHGEYMMQESAVQKWGLSTMNAINEGRNPGIGSGGSYQGSPVALTVTVNGARGDAEIRRLAEEGAAGALARYDKSVYFRVQNHASRKG